VIASTLGLASSGRYGSGARVIIVLTLTLPAAEVLLRVLRAIDAVWFAVLAVLLVWASRRAGAVWVGH
jgi:hypothetical protein